jgi:tRNA-intron endonuclease
MDGRLRGGEVLVGEAGREQFYDARGYGRPLADDSEGALALAPVEAAHLLFREDLDAVATGGARLDFRAFLAEHVAAPRFLVYKDLRDRGFYLTVDAEEFRVHPRGTGPWDGQLAHRVRPVGERDHVSAASLGDAVLGVADEESDLTYLETERREPTGGTTFAPPAASGEVVDDRVLVWDPPESLHRAGFYGQPLDGALVLSLVEAASLAAEGALDIEGDVPALLDRGRAIEGDRFDRRLRAYRTLREAGLVPKTGFKFGTDFRVYDTVESVDELGHAEYLARVLPPDHTFRPRELSLDVRLAHGVRKEMLFGLVGEDAVAWVSVGRLTP